MNEFANLTGKVALVTGAASGIGLACAELLARGGAAVMMSDIDIDSCQQHRDRLAAEGLTVAAQEQNVIDEARWAEVVSACVEQFGGLDILVNNAGIYVGGLLVSNTLEEVRRVQEINVDSIFMGMRAAAEVMKPDGSSGRGGSIINLSSAAGVMGVPGHSAYGASKGAVRLYTKHAAVEFGAMGYGIRVNSVHPGVIDTPMGQQVFDDLVDIGVVDSQQEAQAMIAQLTPLRRPGTVDEVANMVRFLASDAASYCTGGEFMVDGGATAG